MQNFTSDKPVILVLAGHDPTGGAGIHADIESIAANGCCSASIVTCLTIQNTAEFRKSISQKPEDFQEQLECLVQDMHFSACKIGLVTDNTILSIIESTLQALMPIPAVLDPVLQSGTGEKISNRDLYTPANSLFSNLAVITPNSLEARELTGIDNLEKCALDLLKRGCQSVLVTGAHEDTDVVINTLYLQDGNSVQYTWDRLPGNFHGSGCTLSSSIAANLAQGREISEAVKNAQQYTWHTIKNGHRLARHQLHPDRMYFNNP